MEFSLVPDPNHGTWHVFCAGRNPLAVQTVFLRTVVGAAAAKPAIILYALKPGKRRIVGRPQSFLIVKVVALISMVNEGRQCCRQSSCTLSGSSFKVATCASVCQSFWITLVCFR